MLILDLDDTIFKTKSINPKVFEAAFSIIKDYYKTSHLDIDIQLLISDLWREPIDHVFSKYSTPKAIIAEFYTEIEHIDFEQLDIKPFDDYRILQSLTIDKILVTTGLNGLQTAKIKALGIGSDFSNIFIDDPRQTPRQHKIDIFSQILKRSKKQPKDIWVIGDNPASEIKAGNTLGMTTIQRTSNSRVPSEFSDYIIDSFDELKDIIRI